jgi:ribonuclease R
MKKIQGIISVASNGTGYVKIENVLNEKKHSSPSNKKDDLEVDFQNLNTALNGDLVEVVLIHGGIGRQEARVLKIIKRAKVNFVGTLKKQDEIFIFKADDFKVYVEILIPKKELEGAKPGQKVFVNMLTWSDPQKMPTGKVLKILGEPGKNDVEMRSVALERGFDSEFSKIIEDEAKNIKHLGITNKDYIGRRDFRKVFTFKIDPEDAKDFDDAISFKIIGKDLYEIGIHIADVSHYVKSGSKLDLDAQKKGTSVYLVDRTIPMLPEILSNDLCSLIPRQDRLTMSAVFTIDKNAKVKSRWFGRTVINSEKGFSYQEADELIKLKKSEPLLILNNLAKKFIQERFKRGALSLDQEEVKFVLDKNFRPVKVIKKQRGDASKLIEEFMLLANREVAEIVSKKFSGPFIYRVHDLPNKEKMENLAFFLKELGYPVSLKDGIIPSSEINKILQSQARPNVKDTIHRAVIRSMAKAIYTTKNIGHYGLALDYYTHFTSPIRRYPDIMVHRILAEFLENKKTSEEKIEGKLEQYEEIARKASEQEKSAAEAERASIKYKQVEYMSVRIGKIFDGIINGVNEFGLYIEEKETKSEGMVRVKDLHDDFYIFNQKKLELVGKRHKNKYTFGDKVKIQVKKVDLVRKTIDYVLINS